MDKDISLKEQRPASLFFGMVLFVTASLLGISLLSAIFTFSSAQHFLSLPGIILYSAYGFSSLLVPCLILYGAILLLIPGWTQRSGVMFAGSIFPFFTAVAGEILVKKIALTIGSDTFSRLVTAGLIISTLLFIFIEYLLLSHLADLSLKKTGKAVPVSDSRFIFDPIDSVMYTPAAGDTLSESESFDDEESALSDSSFKKGSGYEKYMGDLAAGESLPVTHTISPVNEPMYVDFEKMKAPFDLPVIENWAETDEDASEDASEDEICLDDNLMINDELRTDDEVVPDEEALLDEDELASEEALYEELATNDDLLTHASIINPDDTDFPPVLSVPPAVHDPTPVPDTPFWRKKHRGEYSVPFDILTSYPDGEYWIVDEATRRAAAALKETLNEFSIQADVTGIRKGPVITMFEILPAPGVKLSKIVGLQDNIALRLAASSVRIVAPIPGKHAVGIEVPNQKRSIVSFRELIETDTAASKKMEIPVVLGKDITGEAQILDLALTPHLLIAGSTGSGKSVCVNAIILSILYKRSPEDVRLILIDPKIVELKLYNDIGHLLAPVITEPKKAFQALQYCLCEMERRYSLLDGMGVRDIKSYNKRIKERLIATEKLPYLVVIIDEFADLMATTGKELESTVARLCAMSRAVGIHLVLATQRPSIDVITGLIKANIPSRIAFMVASKMDSRIIIDQMGAEKLLGRGDMLYSSATDPFPVRIQGAFVSEEDVERVVSHVKTLGEPEYIDEEIFIEDDEDCADPSLFSGGDDPLYDKALEIVLLAGKASASYIQRRLKIGYNRAARLVEDMEARGIVGPANGSKPREVVHHP